MYLLKHFDANTSPNKYAQIDKKETKYLKPQMHFRIPQGTDNSLQPEIYYVWKHSIAGSE